LGATAQLVLSAGSINLGGAVSGPAAVSGNAVLTSTAAGTIGGLLDYDSSAASTVGGRAGSLSVKAGELRFQGSVDSNAAVSGGTLVMDSAASVEGSLGVSGGAAKIAGTLGALAIQAGTVETAAQTTITAPSTASLTGGSLAVKHKLTAQVNAEGGNFVISGDGAVNGTITLFNEKTVEVNGSLSAANAGTIKFANSGKYAYGALCLTGSGTSGAKSKFTLDQNQWKIKSNGTLSRIPDAPANLTLSVPETGAVINLSWGAVTGAESYIVYQGTSSSNIATNLGTLTGTTFTNSGLAEGKTYYYAVTAKTEIGEGSKSASQNRMTKVNALYGLTVEHNEKNSGTIVPDGYTQLGLDGNKGLTGYVRVGYKIGWCERSAVIYNIAVSKDDPPSGKGWTKIGADLNKYIVDTPCLYLCYKKGDSTTPICELNYNNDASQNQTMSDFTRVGGVGDGNDGNGDFNQESKGKYVYLYYKTKTVG
jgi:hypothetical protein